MIENILLALTTAVLSSLSSGFEAMFIALNIYDISKINIPAKKYRKIEFIIINKRIFIFLFLFLNTLWNVLFAIAVFNIFVSLNVPEILSGVISILVITPFLFIFSEVLPKAIFRKYKDRIIILTYPVFLPIAVLGSLIFRKKSDDQTSFEHIVATLQKEFESDEYSTITDILKNTAEIEYLKLRDIMSKIDEVGVVSTSTKLKDVFDHFRGREYVIVAENLKVLGFVKIQDILKLKDEKISKAAVLEVLKKPSIVVYEDFQFSRILQCENINLEEPIFVVNDLGNVVGVVSKNEILSTILDTVVKVKSKDITKRTLIAKGEDKVVDILEMLGKNVSKFLQEHPKLNESNVNGLILSLNGFLPKVGEKIKFDEITFEIVEVSEFSVEKVRVSL